MNNGLERTINCWGTSITSGTYPNHLREMLLPHGGFRVIRNKGLGGQTAEQIAIRFGAIPVELQLNQSQLNQSEIDIVNLTGVWDNINNNKQFLSMADQRNLSVFGRFENGFYSTRCLVSRSSVKVGNVSNETYKFTKLNESNVETFFDTKLRFYSDECNSHSKDINIFEIVQNQKIWGFVNWPPEPLSENEFNAVCDRTIFLIKSCIDTLDNPKRYLICGVTGYTQQFRIGTEYEYLRTIINNFEAKIKEAFADNYVDQLSIPTESELKEIGYTPTEQDLTDLNDGVMPSGMMADNIHRQSSGYRLMALRFFKKLKEKGYIQ